MVLNDADQAIVFTLTPNVRIAKVGRLKREGDIVSRIQVDKYRKK